jgi:hypothetical protein
MPVNGEERFACGGNAIRLAKFPIHFSEIQTLPIKVYAVN